jgi:hypothetical protein
MDARLGGGAFEHGQEQVFSLRVSYCTGCLTLFAADAALWMYKHSFHFQPTSFVENLKEYHEPSTGIYTFKFAFCCVNLLSRCDVIARRILPKQSSHSFLLSLRAL